MTTLPLVPLPNEILNIQSKKINNIVEPLTKNKRKVIKCPHFFREPLDCNLEEDTQPKFLNIRGFRPTQIVTVSNKDDSTLDEKIFLPFQEDAGVCEEFFEKFERYRHMTEYSNKYARMRKVKRPFDKMEEDAIEGSKVKFKDKYIAYIKEISKLVYRNIYNKEVNILGPSFFVSKTIEMSNINEDDLLVYDLQNAIAIVKPIYEVLDEITDDKIVNCLFLNTYNFIHPLNWLLSPAALAISFFHYHLLGLKKIHKEENLYARHTLPKVTYLSLTGLFSEVEIDILNALSDNIQTIVVYDENTGGPSLFKDRYEQREDLRASKKHILDISNRLLLVPLKCSDNDNQKTYGPNDMLAIFEEVIIKSIEKYKPSYIMLNISLTFDEDNDIPFWLDEGTLGQIVRMLTLMSENRVIVYPFKLPNMQNDENRNLFEKMKVHLKSKKQEERMESVMDKYAVPYNEKYLSNCLINIMEGLSGMKDANRWDRDDLRRKYGINPTTNQVFYQLGRYYKLHPFYSFLYTKSYGPLARVTNTENINKSGKLSTDPQNKAVESIPIFCSVQGKQNTALQLQLTSSDKEKKLILNENSQYLIDYGNPQEPVLYVFNGRVDEVINNITLPGTFKHFSFPVEYNDNSSTLTARLGFDESVEMDAPEQARFITDAGICKYEDYVFQVYGTKQKKGAEGIDSNQIFCYNFKQEKSFKLELEEDVEEILPRHAVTTCAFEKEGECYIYVFGGQVQPNTVYKNYRLGYLDIIDVVSIYQTSFPPGPKSKWKYSQLPKEGLYGAKKSIYVPYIYSFSYYIEESDTIMIMGGKLFQGSVYDWTFPIFEFSVKENKFTNFETVLNKTRGNIVREDLKYIKTEAPGSKTDPKKKETKPKACKRPAVPIAIADKNKNFVLNRGNRTFDFLLPCREDSRAFIYSYSPDESSCNFDEVLLEKAQKVAPPSLSHAEGTPKAVTQNIRMTTKIKYLASSHKEILLELVNWRFSIEKSSIDNATVFTKCEEMEKNCLENLENDPSLKQTKLALFEDIKNLLSNNADILEVFRHKDSRLEGIRIELTGGNADYRNQSFIEPLDDSVYGFSSRPFTAKELTESDIHAFWMDIMKPQSAQNVLWTDLNEEQRKRITGILDNFITLLKKFVNKNSHKKEFDPIEKKLRAFLKEIGAGDETTDMMEVNIKGMSKNFNSFTGSVSGLSFDATVSADQTSILGRNFNSSGVNRSREHNLGEIIDSSTHSSVLSGLSQDKQEQFATSFNSALSNSGRFTQNSVDHQSMLKEAYNSMPKSFSIRKVASGLLIILHKLNLTSNSSHVEVQFEKNVIEQFFLSPLQQLHDRLVRDSSPKSVESPVTQTGSPIKLNTSGAARIISVDKSQYSVIDDKEIRPIKTFKDESVQTDAEIVPKQQESLVQIPVPQEEEKVDIIQNFKACLMGTTNYRAFFNGSKSELIIVQKCEGEKEELKRRLRFKVSIKGKKGREVLEDISFESSPSSIWVYRDCVVCYIDHHFKYRYQDVFQACRNYVLYADIGSTLQQMDPEDDTDYLVFKKLFVVAQDEQIFHRCLVVNEDNIFLFGGKSYKYKSNKATLHGDVSMYDLKKFQNVSQNSSSFKDTEVDQMENTKGECVAVFDGTCIFVCKKTDPTIVEIYNKNGVLKETVELPSTFKSCSVTMSLINFRKKAEILFTKFRKDKNIEFELFNVKNGDFEEGGVELETQEGEKMQLMYSGFEEIEVNTGQKSVKEDIMLNIMREDAPKVIVCKIVIGEK